MPLPPLPMTQRERLAEATKQLVLRTKCAKQPPPPEVAAIAPTRPLNWIVPSRVGIVAQRRT